MSIDYIAGGGLGELMFVIVSIAYMVEERKSIEVQTSRMRWPLLVLQLFFVLVGLEIAIIGAITHPPEWIWIPNTLLFTFVPLVVVRSYPFDTRSMLVATFGPWAYGIAWALLTWLLTGGTTAAEAVMLHPIIFLGAHYIALLGPLFVFAFFKPPEHAPLYPMPLVQRLREPGGILLLSLAAAWCLQSIIVLVAHGNIVFGSDPRSASIGVGLFVLSLLSSLPGLKATVLRQE